MIVFSSFGHARFVFACVVQPVISRPGSPGGLLREVSLVVVFPSFGHARFVFAAVVCPVISRPGSKRALTRGKTGNRRFILWAFPVRFCLCGPACHFEAGKPRLALTRGKTGNRRFILWAFPVLSVCTDGQFEPSLRW